MRIMCKQEYYDQVVQYAESIKDTSLQNCMERLEACLLYTSDAADE